MRKPLIFLSLIALAVIAAVLVADPDPAKLRSLRDGLVDWRDAHPLALPIGFFVTYVVVTALSLPFAVWLTLLGAALLGFWQGLVLISFASSFGALLAFLVARYLMRDWVRGRLGELDSLSGIVSPGLLGAFAALAVFPWVARAVLRIWTRRRAYRGYKRPAKFDRNLIVIGAGAAGLVASYVAAQAKAKVTLVQEGPMGGDCLNFGCVPSKALIASARAAGVARRSADLGVKAEVSVDWPVVMRRISEVIAQIAPNDSVERYQGLGVEVIEGHARLEDPWTVRMGERRLTARGIVLATGAAPVIPPIEGIETVEPLTSDTLWDALAAMAAPPGKMVILGGGPIGCEIAQALARLGAGVTLIEAAERLLIREDAEAAETIEAALRADGVEVRLGAKAIRFGRDAGKWLELEDGSKLQFDTLLVAVGRKARLEGFGLEDLGIPANRVIETNDYLETLMPNIYAAGDVAGPMQLTNAAGHQGWIAAANALASPFWRFKAHAAPIPHAVFTAPELARVGMTAAQAEAEGVAHEVTTYPLGDLDRALAEGAGEGFVRIVTAKGSDKILGVTICGAHAAEVLAEFVLAMRHGLGLGKILATPHVYPSWSEAAKNAAGRWRQAHVNPSTLKIAERFMSWRRG
ncbi:MAG: FAD-dependent oxidoreductase [Thioclava sp.]|nr:FAD-dependent oxidoreductase [Thioclava sp.]MBD3801909.1 FAD-dependent oxidoreductase [Thioclava sp.]